MKRKDTPIVAKIFAGITVGYALSPIDVVPDFIPVLGYLDDLITVSYTHLRAHETPEHLVCRLLLEKKNH